LQHASRAIRKRKPIACFFMAAVGCYLHYYLVSFIYYLKKSRPNRTRLLLFTTHLHTIICFLFNGRIPARLTIGFGLQLGSDVRALLLIIRLTPSRTRCEFSLCGTVFVNVFEIYIIGSYYRPFAAVCQGDFDEFSEMEWILVLIY